MAPKTNAQNQAAYRRRQLQDVEDSAERLDVLIDTVAKTNLKRLATHYRVSLRVMLDRMIESERNALLATLDGDEQSAFYDSHRV